MIPLPHTRGGWRCLLADPPWRFGDSATRGAAARHYATISAEEIAALPIESLAARDAVLVLWFPDTHLTEALLVAHEWGFTYKHLVTWGKVGPTGKIQIGLGHWFRKAHEAALFCVRGRPLVRDHGVPSLILAPRTQHSAKPEQMHAALERLCAGPRLELFARRARPGWTVWGDEAPAKGRAA